MLGADLFVQCLENEGVEYVFGLPGEEIADVLKALSLSKKIKFILVKQEQSASFMADVYGRLTGKAGVCLSTLGPGATNLLTGVADAYLDRAPLVAITGQGGLERMYQESHQYIDVVSVYKFVTKWNRSITRGEFIPQVVRKAFSVAESEKSGAVHIELPEDVAAEDSDFPKPLSTEQKYLPSFVSSDGAKRVASLIEESSFPLILAGNGVIRSNASRELASFAKAYRIPVVNTFMGKGVISSNDELSLGTIGLQTRDLASCAFEKSDLVIAVGYDFVEYDPKFWNTNNAKIIHVDSTPSETDAYYATTLELVGNIRATLELLIPEARAKARDLSYALKIRSMINAELSRFSDDDSSFPLKPQKVIYELRRALSDEDILVSDVGMHKIWIARLYPAYAPNTVIISNGFASMGISIPGAIAAKLARPERNVIAACGDGGFMMNLHELETAKRLGTNFIGVIFEDGQYSQIEWRQRLKFGESYYTNFNNPDFVSLAKSFGWEGIRVSSARELRDSLNHALDSKQFCILDVPVDVKENMLLSSRLGSNLACP
ncbi:MAG: acetolactate synthase large subunit [Nitrososphaerales archaeon]